MQNTTFTTKRKQLHLISLGCTKNLIDSEVMLGRLKEYEICDDISDSDVIIVNTCGFIEEAKKESIDTILQAHNDRKKDSILVVSGCLSQRYQEELASLIPEVDLFTGVGDYNKIDELIQNKQNIFSDNVFLIDDSDERVVTGSSYHAFVKLSEGCNQSCSFCAIPSFKGKLKSREISSIVSEVRALIKKGFYDFTFISQDSSSFAKDLGVKYDGLIPLIKEIERLDNIKSARILYLYPTSMTYELIDTIIKSDIFISYFDIPLQHISDKMLLAMKRGKHSDSIKKMIEYVKEKDKNAFLRTGFIVGHPQESDEDFTMLCDFIKDSAFDRISVFKYSDEEGTKAYSMDGKIPEDIIEQRLESIEAIVAQKIQESFDNEIGRECLVDINGISDEHEYLLSAKKDIWTIDIDGDILINDKEIAEDIKYNRRYKAIITDCKDTTLIAKIIG
jgi:ribosomal protein S12 methylthiotransferase RimO